jgi:hypothetical protein
MLLVLMAIPARAGDLAVIGTYDNKGVEAKLLTYTENGVVVGLVGMEQNGVRISYAFAHSDWAALEKIWSAAVQTTGSEYVAAGSVAETGTKAKCVITASGGPTVRLIIVDPSDGAIMFDVPNVSDFDAKLRQVAAATTN